MSKMIPYRVYSLNPELMEIELNSSPSLSDRSIFMFILSKIYSNPFSQEFRRPVHILHPSLLKSYLEVINDPIDLATMMLKVHREEYLTFESFRSDIQLLFSNAIRFNQDTLNMVSTSKHLLFFTRVLWEHNIGLPFLGNSSRADFASSRHNSRLEIYDFCRNEVLNEFEINELCRLLCTINNIPDNFIQLHKEMIVFYEQSFSRNYDETVPNIIMTLSAFFRKFIRLLSEITFTIKNANIFDNNNSQHVHMDDYLAPVFLSCELRRDPQFSFEENSKRQDVLDTIPFLDPLKLHYINQIDEIIGDVLTMMVERKTRGFNLSAVWGRPYKLVWAQPTKTPWWPGMVLAGTGIPRILADVNYSRLPDDIARDLTKVRPRFQPGSTESAVLVEFFGTHDFGWVRTDSLHLFTPDANQLLKKEKGITGNCTQESIREAIESVELLTAVDSLVEEVILPSIEELELELEGYTPDILFHSSSGNIEESPSNMEKKSNKSNDHHHHHHHSGGENSSHNNCNMSSSNRYNELLMQYIDMDLPADASFKQRAYQRTVAYSAYLNEYRPLAMSEKKSKRWGSRGKGGEDSDSVPPLPPKKGKSKGTPPQSGPCGLSGGLDGASAKPRKRGRSNTGSYSSQDEDEHRDNDGSEDMMDVDQSLEGGEEGEAGHLITGTGAGGSASQRGYTNQKKDEMIVVREFDLSGVIASIPIAGDGVVHCRKVDLASPIFFLESKAREERKAKLRIQLVELRKEATRLQEVTSARILDKLAMEQYAESIAKLKNLETKGSKHLVGTESDEVVKPTSGRGGLKSKSPVTFTSGGRGGRGSGRGGGRGRGRHSASALRESAANLLLEAQSHSDKNHKSTAAVSSSLPPPPPVDSLQGINHMDPQIRQQDGQTSNVVNHHRSFSDEDYQVREHDDENICDGPIVSSTSSKLSVNDNAEDENDTGSESRSRVDSEHKLLLPSSSFISYD